MPNIYDQHRAAFPSVSAYAVVSKRGERIASIAFKFPRDGAGRLYCYLHVFGVEMSRGWAGGGGYDKKSAAAAEAAAHTFNKLLKWTKEDEKTWRKTAQHIKRIYNALEKGHSGGADWQRELELAGYNVFQAV